MFSLFYTHPLFEPQLIEQVIELIDCEGAHVDRPIVVHDPRPVRMMMFIRRSQDQCLVALENNEIVFRSFSYLSRHFPNLVFDYFEREITWDLNPLEMYSMVTTIGFFYNNQSKRYTLVKSEYGYGKWVRESTFSSYLDERVQMHRFH